MINTFENKEEKVKKLIDIYKLSEKEHYKVYEIIKKYYLRDIQKSEHPIAIIVGAQPGSGKGSLIGYSKKLFNNLTNVRYKPDVVFGLNVNKSDKEKKSVGFSIISARGAIDSEEYIHKYAELISYYQRKGYKIYLFSFCKKEGDEETINNILKLLDKKDNINSVFYRGNIESFLKIYSSVEQVYCGRFHSMILSMLYSQKIYPVIYSDKMTNVLKDISYKGDVVFMKDFHLLDPKHLFETINSNSYDIDNEAKEAVKQFEILDKHLS